MRQTVLLLVLLLLGACAPAAQQIVPTERPTVTPTLTDTPTRTPGPANATPTATQTRPPASPTGGPSPTSLLGPTSTAADPLATATPVPNPNAPRIEFFTSDSRAVVPGSDVTLFWSTRGIDAAIIYRIDPGGARNQLWNVPPDGNLTVGTREADRGSINFVLSVGEGNARVEQTLSLPLSCPVNWFFVPSPAECPNNEPEETELIEQPFTRGRMVYARSRDEVYALFNDGFDPAWVSYRNLYNPEIHPESIENFPLQPGQVQPIGILGFVWRGRDNTRSRLGLGTQQSFTYDGFIQTAQAGESESLYISSSDGTVLQLLPEGEAWQIITLP